MHGLDLVILGYVPRYRQRSLCTWLWRMAVHYREYVHCRTAQKCGRARHWRAHIRVYIYTIALEAVGSHYWSSNIRPFRYLQPLINNESVIISTTSCQQLTLRAVLKCSWKSGGQAESLRNTPCPSQHQNVSIPCLAGDREGPRFRAFYDNLSAHA